MFDIKRMVIRRLPFALLEQLMIFKWRIQAIAVKRKNVGIHSHIDPTVQVVGWSNVRVGNYTIISEDTWINVNHRGGDIPRVTIGDHCLIGRRNFLSSGISICIGDFCLTNNDCHFLGARHLPTSPMIPYIAADVTPGGTIEIGVNCWIATSSTIMENVKIGCGSIVGARSVVTRDIPPFSIAIGNPCRVVKRFDFEHQEWIPIAEWSPTHELGLPAEEEYAEEIRKRFPRYRSYLLASSHRFGNI